MAYFAEIDENNIVLRVLVVPNEQEDRGQEFLANDLGLGGTWIQTGYNSNMRKRFAGIGFTYDEDSDEFIPPHPYPSWIWDGETWNSPVPYPDDNDEIYHWNEEEQEWEKE